MNWPYILTAIFIIIPGFISAYAIRHVSLLIQFNDGKFYITHLFNFKTVEQHAYIYLTQDGVDDHTKAEIRKYLRLHKRALAVMALALVAMFSVRFARQAINALAV